MMLRIELVKSLNGRLKKHIATAESLGLRRIGLNGARGNERPIVPTERGGRRSIHGSLPARTTGKMQDYKGDG